jgi:hypothetical protein
MRRLDTISLYKPKLETESDDLKSSIGQDELCIYYASFI